jgi:predicted transposase YbfD/YdcC
MPAAAKLTLTDHFASLSDPRMKRTRLHDLNSMVVMAICATICTCDDWVSVASFAKAKRAWFETFLDLPHGIPSHDTFSRVFSKIDPQEFSECFAKWTQSVAANCTGDVVAIDGKTLRRSFNRAASTGAIHMVSAWSCANQIVLAQVKTGEKSNEITAIPQLLKLLYLKGAIVTIDAMGCQKTITKNIVDKGAHYILAVKNNQPALQAEVKAYFEETTGAEGVQESQQDFHEEISVGHGRKEIRRVWASSDLGWMKQGKQWAHLRSIAMVVCERTLSNGSSSIDVRYFISSLPAKARKIAAAVRSHWQVENSLHWVMDIAFREDESRVRNAHGAQNLSVFRHIALNLLKGDTSQKLGIKNKRLLAGWDADYLLKLLGF